MVSRRLNLPVVVAVRSVRVVQVPLDEIIDVIAVRYGFVAAIRTVDVVALAVLAALVSRRANTRVSARFGKAMAVHMIIVHVVQVPFVQIIGVPFVNYRRVPAVGAVVMRMSLVDFTFVHTGLLCAGPRAAAVLTRTRGTPPGISNTVKMGL